MLELGPEVVKRALATLSELPEATRRSSCGCHVPRRRVATPRW
jgi:hypothetical protein